MVILVMNTYVIFRGVLCQCFMRVVMKFHFISEYVVLWIKLYARSKVVMELQDEKSYMEIDKDYHGCRKLLYSYHHLLLSTNGLQLLVIYLGLFTSPFEWWNLSVPWYMLSILLYRVICFWLLFFLVLCCCMLVL